MRVCNSLQFLVTGLLDNPKNHLELTANFGIETPYKLSRDFHIFDSLLFI